MCTMLQQFKIGIKKQICHFAEKLCLSITGDRLKFKYFMDYAIKKYTGLYNLY